MAISHFIFMEKAMVMDQHKQSQWEISTTKSIKSKFQFVSKEKGLNSFDVIIGEVVAVNDASS